MDTTRRNLLRHGAGGVTGIALTGCNVLNATRARGAADPVTAPEKYHPLTLKGRN